jgi:hypothetical protein
MSALIIDVLSIYFELFEKNKILAEKALTLLSVIYIITEISTFFIYINKNICNSKVKLAIKILLGLFYLLVTYTCYNHYFSYYDTMLSWISVIESLFILIPCLFYYYQLFVSQETTLKNHPPFWVVTGILFYTSCSIPVFLLVDYINKNLSGYYNVVFSLNYVLYILLFSLFIKAYLCKREVTY